MKEIKDNMDYTDLSVGLIIGLLIGGMLGFFLKKCDKNNIQQQKELSSFPPSAIVQNEGASQ
jgi:uncharacterized membrane-anchored protein YhcB (DUF1043 family)